MKQLLLSFTILDYFQKLSKELSTILADNGVKVITAESYKSTPELSHAIRYYGADGGVMITASHNPKIIMVLKFIMNMVGNYYLKTLKF